MSKNLSFMKHLIFLIALTFSITSVLYSQSEVENYLKLLQNKFDSIESLSVEFVQLKNDNPNMSGSLYLKKENNIKIVTNNFTVTSNGKTAWNYNKAEKKVIISNVDENDPEVFSLNKIVYEFPKECEVSFSSDGEMRTITLLSKGYTYNFNKIVLQLNDDDLISKVKISDPSLGETVVTFSDYVLNLNLPDSEFTFIPPEGTKIIDLR